jgi:hypothetical protein
MISMVYFFQFIMNFHGGGRGIRTPVGLHPNGFQDRPVMTASVSLRIYDSLWCGRRDSNSHDQGSLPPQDSVSANSTTTAWWALQDSNLRPIGYEPTALPAELRAHLASQKRFELLTHGLEGRCSILLSYWDSFYFGGSTRI